MVEPMVTEKRLFQRFPCFLHGNFKISSNQPGYAIFQNFSAFGAEFKTYTNLDEGEKLNFNMMTKNMLPLSFGGKVRWCQKLGKFWHVGISFDRPMFIPLNNLM